MEKVLQGSTPNRQPWIPLGAGALQAVGDAVAPAVICDSLFSRRVNLSVACVIKLSLEEIREHCGRHGFWGESHNGREMSCREGLFLPGFLQLV